MSETLYTPVHFNFISDCLLFINTHNRVIISQILTKPVKLPVILGGGLRGRDRADFTGDPTEL